MVVSCFKVKLIGKKHIGNRPVLKAAKPSKKFANRISLHVVAQNRFVTSTNFISLKRVSSSFVSGIRLSRPSRWWRIMASDALLKL